MVVLVVLVATVAVIRCVQVGEQIEADVNKGLNPTSFLPTYPQQLLLLTINSESQELKQKPTTSLYRLSSSDQLGV